MKFFEKKIVPLGGSNEKEILKQRLEKLKEEKLVVPADMPTDTVKEAKTESQPQLTTEERQALAEELSAKEDHLKMVREFSRYRDFRNPDDRILEENLEIEIEKIKKKINASENIQ